MKFIRNTLTVILSIMFFFLSLCYSSLLFINYSLEQEQIEKYIEKIDIFSLPSKDIFNDTYNDDKMLKDVIASKLEDSNIKKELTLNILESKELNSFLANISKKYLNYLLLNEEKPVVTDEELMLVINEPIIEQSLNKQLSYQEKEQLNKFIKDSVLAINKELPEKETTILDEKTSLFIKEILNLNYSLYGIIIVVVFFIVIALLNWSFLTPLLALAIPSSVLGFLLIITYFIEKLISSKLINVNGAIETIALKGIDILFSDVLYFGLLIVGISLILLIIRVALKKIFIKEEIEEEKIVPKKKESIESKKLK